MPDFAEMTFLQRVLRPGDGFVDVGANVGVYTLLAATRVGPEGHVVAVEPNRESCWRLRENVAGNALENVTIVQKAVADKVGFCTLTEDAGTMNRILEIRETDEAPGPSWVSTTTIDSLRCSNAMFGKIDIEGLEVWARRGAMRSLAERRPAAWVLEANDCCLRYGLSQPGTTSGTSSKKRAGE